jgi:hypothetical protein
MVVDYGRLFHVTTAKHTWLQVLVLALFASEDLRL